MISPTGDGAWAKPSREHWEAINGFLEAAAAVPPEQWDVPLGPGRWSPAQQAEHILRTYNVALDQVRTGSTMRRRAGPVVQRLLRWFLLPHLIFHRSLPLRATAPREVVPSDAGLRQEELPVLLGGAAAEVELEFARTHRTHLVHAYFGPIELRRGLRFLAAHTDHHRKQLVGSRRSLSPSRT
jgi:hypothetical protein